MSQMQPTRKAIDHPHPQTSKPKRLRSNQWCRVMVTGRTGLLHYPGVRSTAQLCLTCRSLEAMIYCPRRSLLKFPVAPEEVAAALCQIRRTSHLLPALRSRAVPSGRITTVVSSSLACRAGVALLPTSGGLVCSTGGAGVPTFPLLPWIQFQPCWEPFPVKASVAGCPCCQQATAARQ